MKNCRINDKNLDQLCKGISFCIIIPMYNEEGNAERCIRTIGDFLNKIEVKTAIIVVNDGSTDRTSEILGNLSNSIKNMIIEMHINNEGYGAANNTGVKRAIIEGFDYALFMDSDLTQNTNYIYSFMEKMDEGIDYIKATRYAKHGGVQGVPFKRWLISWVGNLLARALLRLPLTDYTNGFRAVKTNILSNIECRESGFAYLIEEIRKASKYVKTYAEVPYILTVREDNFSKSKFNYSIAIFIKYIRNLIQKT